MNVKPGERAVKILHDDQIPYLAGAPRNPERTSFTGTA